MLVNVESEPCKTFSNNCYNNAGVRGIVTPKSSMMEHENISLHDAPVEETTFHSLEYRRETFAVHKRSESGRFRLLVDRQLKGSYTTAEAAETVGLRIKEGHPIVQVAIYDALEGTNKAIELPTI
jgi:hypothetical protein